MATAKSEREEIRSAGAKPQPNSGRGSHKKGDAILEPFCVDIKEYEKSYSLSVKGWAKVCTDAFSSGRRLPAFKIVLGKRGENRLRLWVVGDQMFQEMREAWLEKYGEDNE
jgi:hypothetical protein